jgi:gliding motility-associated-like protein
MRYLTRLLIAGFLILTGHPSWAQYEYAATLNYQTFGLNRLNNIPGATWILGDNDAYDPIHQQILFLGNATSSLPFNLFTIDAVTGGVVYSPPCPSNFTGGDLAGLQLDAGTDTLYALYANGMSTLYFSWIDPSTGVVTNRSSLGSPGYLESTFNMKDHWYIMSTGPNLMVIYALTGQVVYNTPFVHAGIFDLLYDNTTNTLYGIDNSGTTPGPQFDSISLATGALHVIANLPPMSLPHSNSYAIDEVAGRFIFAGSDPSTTQCTNTYLYSLDIQTGAILSKVLDPYSNAFSLTSENVIDFSFDHLRGVLYALNWFPPPTMATAPVVTIQAAYDTLCAGQPQLFTATQDSPLLQPTYQWQVNGANAGADSAAWVNTMPVNGDTVRCILANHSGCALLNMDTSNNLVIRTMASPGSSVHISTPVDSVCSGETVLFQATPVNGGTMPAYQWQIGTATFETQSAELSANSLSNGAQVSCIMTGNLTCSQPSSPSDTITMTVFPRPTVLAGRDTVLVPGSSLTLTPTVTGAISSYAWTPATGLSSPASEQTTATPTSTTTYQLSVISAQGCMAEGQVTLSINYPFRMPGAFTPNGDGINDVFRIPTSAPQKVINFSVFDRWGNRVFVTADSQVGWDGTNQHTPLSSGTYIWTLVYENVLTGKTEKAEGTVVLIR